MSPDRDGHRDEPPVRPDLHELLGAFALDAVEPHERSEIEQYLDTDPGARREVDELRETAALLALAHVGDEPVPAGVWARIESELGDQAGATGEPTSPPVTPIGSARSARASNGWRSPRVLAVAAAIVLVAGIAAGLAIRGSRSGSSDLQAAYRRASHSGVELRVVDAATKRRTLARIAFDASSGNGYMRNEHMAPLPAGEVYQLWVVPGGSSKPLSAGVLGREPSSIAAFHWSGSIQGMAISVERAPGAAVPSRVVAATA